MYLFCCKGISVLIADCVMLHCTKNRKYFARMKELDIDMNTAAKSLQLTRPLIPDISENKDLSNKNGEIIQTPFVRV